jgi:hypothetical protein
MNTVIRHEVHLAAQYLAAAGISFLDKKEDDSHTNLQYNADEATLHTRPLNEAGDTLSFNYNDFSLVWNDNEKNKVFGLDGKSHEQVLKWIQATTTVADLKLPYRYQLHYELPYEITDAFTFKLSDLSALKKLGDIRTLAQNVLEVFVEEQQLKSEVRVWPHHFDTGAFAPLKNNTDVSISLGMAIPDTICDDHYFYIAGYKEGNALVTNKLPRLSVGKWMNEGFKGAILPVGNSNSITVHSFYKEALFHISNV